MVPKAKFEYSPLGHVLNKGLEKDEKQVGLLKRLKNIEDKIYGLNRRIITGNKKYARKNLIIKKSLLTTKNFILKEVIILNMTLVIIDH